LLPVSERVAASVFWLPAFTEPEPGLSDQYVAAVEKVAHQADRLPALPKHPSA
jgi:hypothetical protein